MEQWSAALATLEGYGGAAYSVTFSLDCRWFVSSDEDDTVRLWYSEPGVALATLNGYGESVVLVAVSLDS